MRVHSNGEHGERPFLAKERGLDVREVRHEREGDYHTLVRVTASTATGNKCVAGTLFGNSAPRLVDIFGVAVEADLAGPMLYIVNNDAPGFIGKLGTTLGSAGINIATFNLGRRAAGGEAVALVAVTSLYRRNWWSSSAGSRACGRSCR
jgi:D-3-phosphoglycerate dehydrogenase